MKIGQSAPTDGRDPFDGGGIYTSKQNSDAGGMMYQWGIKEPFTFATSSEKWGVDWQIGKYPVKIYTIDGVLIYQKTNGYTNKDEQPVGGVIVSWTLATAMMETIKNPITFYGENGAVINQEGHTKSLWNYYWTSYSRGTDGGDLGTKWHNDYLYGYVSQRLKSIYDPCPYGFRIPSNGTYNQLQISSGWVWGSYLGGLTWDTGIKSRFISLGRRDPSLSYIGIHGFYSTSTISRSMHLYSITFTTIQTISLSHDSYAQSQGMSVRCIEEVKKYYYLW